MLVIKEKDNKNNEETFVKGQQTLNRKDVPIMIHSSAQLSINKIGYYFEKEPFIFDTWRDFVNLTSKYDEIEQVMKINSENYIRQPMESQNNFNQIISEFGLHSDSKEVDNIICHTAINYLSNSESPTFLPEPLAVSFVFYYIIIQNIGEPFECRSSAFLFIKNLLRKYPPHSPESRLYWLLALTHTNELRTQYESGVNYDIRKGIANLHALLMQTLSNQGNEENIVSEIADLLLELFEADQYFYEINTSSTKKSEIILLKNVSFRLPSCKNDCLIMEQSLAYSIGTSYEARYSFGIDKKHKDLINRLAKSVAGLVYSEKTVKFAVRLHIVLLEALHFAHYHLKSFSTKPQIKEDLIDLFRRLAFYGLKKTTVKEFYPVKWMYEIIENVSFKKIK